MPSYADTVFEKEVRRILDERMLRLSLAVARGEPQTNDAYRERVGEIRGIETALKACDEARRLIAGEPPADLHDTRRKANAEHRVL